jgi:Myb-like DNA-binding domain
MVRILAWIPGLDWADISPDFDIDKIQGDDDPTPPPSPLLARTVQKPQVKVKNSRAKRAGLRGKPEATEQPRQPPALKRARKAEKKTKPGATKWESPEPQLMLEADRLRRKDSPEAFGVYASSEASGQEESSRKFPVEASSGKQRLNERKKRRLKEIVSDSPHVGSANKGKIAPSVEHSDSEHMELDGQTKAEDLEKEDANNTIKREQSPEPALEAFQDGQSTATGNGESGHQGVEPREPSEEEDDTVAADFEHVQIAETQQECPVENVQAFAASATEDRVAISAEMISAENVEMEGAKVVSSDQDTSSTNSVFDPADSPAPANNLPAPKSGLKRKRGASQSTKVSVTKTAKPNKKQRRNAFSPPSSVEPMGEVETTTKPSNKKRKIADASNKKAKASGSRKLSASQPTLGSWVKSLSSDVSLKHLPYQPTPAKKRLSRTIADFVSQSATLAGPSNSRISIEILKRPNGWPKKAIEQINADENSDKTLASKIGPITVQTSAKGKQKAKPDINYTSPSPKGSRNVPGSPDLGGNANVGGFATSVARRDFPGRGSRAKDMVPVSEDSDKSASSSDDTEPDTDSESSRHGSDSNEAAGEADTSIEDSHISKSHLCKKCHRTFKTAEILRLHWSREGIHDNLLKCSDCSDTFFSVTALAKHRRKRSHGGGTGSEGRKGPFSADEVRKIEEWRDSFCAEFEIDQTVFNDMMVASCRRGRDTSWNWNFIVKHDFLKQYNSLLPNRNRRSMLRYRERNFQNVETSKVWTKDDDDELENLVKELGTKWTEIGQRLTRTSDAVSQRWRNRVQHRHKMNGGDWKAQETKLLETAIVKLKTRLGVPLDETSDYRIAWSKISNEMGNIRTAQQCSNHWKWLAQERKYSEARKVPKRFNDGGELKTKEKRRSEEARRRRPPSKAAISDKYVKESDEGSEGEREAANGNEQEESESDVQESRSKSAERTKQQRRDLPKVAESSLQRSVMLTKKGAHSLPDPQSTESGTPGLPYNPVATRTPARDMTLSQAFGHTQANTSALRGSRAGGEEVLEVADSQDRPERPSPAIEVRLRAGAVEEGEEADEEVQDNDRVAANSENEVEEEAPETLSVEEIASAEVDSTKSESDEPRTKIKMSQELGGDDESEEESSEGEDEGSDEEEDAVEEDQERNDELPDETSSSGSTSESGSDSMVEDTRDDFKAMNQNDFMANLKATADRSKGRVVGVARRRVDAKMDDSESDSDSE